MKMKKVEPNPIHIAMRDDMLAAMKKYDSLPADEILAVAAYVLGQLIALQDQRKMTAVRAMEIVRRNIIAGNEHVIADLEKTQGTKN